MWEDYPYRSENLENISVFQYIENFRKGRLNTGISKGLQGYNFKEKHQEYTSHTSYLLSKTHVRSVNILPYHRFSEDSVPWKKQMVLAFSPWRYVTDSDEKRICFGNHLSDIGMSEDFVNLLYNLLLGKSSPHFDRYFEQIQKRKT